MAAAPKETAVARVRLSVRDQQPTAMMPPMNANQTRFGTYPNAHLWSRQCGRTDSSGDQKVE